MSLPEIVILSLVLLLIVLVVILLIIQLRNKNNNIPDVDIEKVVSESMQKEINRVREFLSQSIEHQMKSQTDLVKEKFDGYSKLQEVLSSSVKENSKMFSDQIDKLRQEVNISLKELQESNAKKLDEMRGIVDEKLQKTLEDRFTSSFERVTKQLQDVYVAVGEMKKVGENVVSLKTVLTNVKTKGIFGEVQLGNILADILNKSQYETNFKTKKNSNDPVEYAIRLPGTKDEPIYLPIDSKFPLEDYQHLLDSYDEGDKEKIESYRNKLKSAVKRYAKDIHSKYIDVPHTTDFGIMFLPLEGLYAEVLKTGVVEEIQRDSHINVAGPTTMAALLNSLQMGFRTLTLQKRSSEVWKILSNVKKEFNTFEEVLSEAQKKLNLASDSLEKVVGVRTRQIKKSLSDITDVPEIEEDK